MSDRSGIEWTEATWNPVTGCSKVSPGCAHCYAETISHRFKHTSQPWTPEHAAENVRLHPERLEQPSKWRRPRVVFVNSMSDLFHELVPVEFIVDVFRSMAAAPQHTFQVLTKRPERMRDVLPEVYSQLQDGEPSEPLENVWLGTSVENARFAWRVDCLRDTSAAIRFISAEPLLGPLGGLDLAEIDWVIVGGESGSRHRPMQADWARDLRDHCQSADVAYFFKQWGGRTPKAGGRELDGRTWDEMPDAPRRVELAVG